MLYSSLKSLNIKALSVYVSDVTRSQSHENVILSSTQKMPSAKDKNPYKYA